MESSVFPATELLASERTRLKPPRSQTWRIFATEYPIWHSCPILAHAPNLFCAYKETLSSWIAFIRSRSSIHHGASVLQVIVWDYLSLSCLYNRFWCFRQRRNMWDIRSTNTTAHYHPVSLLRSKWINAKPWLKTNSEFRDKMKAWLCSHYDNDKDWR